MISNSQLKCSENAETIVFSICTTNILAFLFFTVMNFGLVFYTNQELIEDVRKAMRFLAIIILSAFIFVYILVLYYFYGDSIEEKHKEDCSPL